MIAGGATEPRRIRREIYVRLPEFHRLAVDLAVIDGDWVIVENDAKIEPSASVSRQVRPVVGSDSATTTGVRYRD